MKHPVVMLRHASATHTHTQTHYMQMEMEEESASQLEETAGEGYVGIEMEHTVRGRKVGGG